MSITINTTLEYFKDKLNITSTRMARDYGLATVDEIIEKEAERGNVEAFSYMQECNHSPQKLIRLFKLISVDNRFGIIKNMRDVTRQKLLSQMEPQDLIYGLYFFTKEGLLRMLYKTDTKELVNVARETFSLEYMMEMFDEDDFAAFFMNQDLDKSVVLEQIRNLPQDVMQKFIEGVTGMTYNQENTENLMKSIEELPEDKFRKFMAAIDPEVQKQLAYQITSEDAEKLELFPNIAYVKLMNELMKPDIVKAMVNLNQDTILKMIDRLPPLYTSMVASQIDPTQFAYFLQNGHMDLLERAIIQ